jgi:hypothetical protein
VGQSLKVSWRRSGSAVRDGHDRAHHTAVERVKARTTVRTIVLEDVESGHNLGLVRRGLGWSHSKEVVKALVGHDIESDDDTTLTDETAP